MTPLYVEAQAWARVLMFRGETAKPGTALLIDVGDRPYLVTAKHLTNGERDEAVFVTSHSYAEAWPQQLLLTRVGHMEEDGADVAVYRMDERWVTPDLVLPLGLDGLVFSQSVLAMGYPVSLEMRLAGGPQVLPMAKGGIVGGIDFGGEGGVTEIFVDLVANPGMSGGPLLFRHQGTGRLTVAGIMKGTYTQRAVPSEGWDHDVSAGISVAHDIKHALNLIEQQ